MVKRGGVCCCWGMYSQDLRNQIYAAGRQEVSTENRQNLREVFNKYQGKTKGSTCISCRSGNSLRNFGCLCSTQSIFAAFNKATWQFLSTAQAWQRSKGALGIPGNWRSGHRLWRLLTGISPQSATNFPPSPDWPNKLFKNNSFIPAVLLIHCKSTDHNY